MMKLFLVAIVSAFLMFSASVYADNVITVTVDDEEVYFNDASPVIVNDRVYVPVRAVFESLGAYVEWNASSRTVYAYRRFLKVVMSVDDGVYYVNSDKHTMVSKALILNDRLMIPVRDVSEALSASVGWDESARKVVIYSPKEMYNVDDMYLEFWKKHDDNIVMTGIAAYPRIDAEGQITTAFNDFILGESEAYADSTCVEYFDKAVNDFESIETKDAFMPYMFERWFDITHDADSVISLLFCEETYTDGSLPLKHYESMTYDMNTGRLLEAWDVLEVSESEIRRRVREGLTLMVKENPDDFYYDAKAIIENGMGKLNWYMKDDGVYFYVNPGIIAPVSYGVVEFKI